MSRKTLFSKGEYKSKQERYYKAEMEGELDREIVLCMCVSKRKRELMGKVKRDIVSEKKTRTYRSGAKDNLCIKRSEVLWTYRCVAYYVYEDDVTYGGKG